MSFLLFQSLQIRILFLFKSKFFFSFSPWGPLICWSVAATDILPVKILSYRDEGWGACVWLTAAFIPQSKSAVHKTRGLVLFLPFPSQKTRGHSSSSPNLLNVTWNPTEFDTRLFFLSFDWGPYYCFRLSRYKSEREGAVDWSLTL